MIDLVVLEHFCLLLSIGVATCAGIAIAVVGAFRGLDDEEESK